MSDLKQRATERFAAVEDDLRKLSRWMYDNPEVAFEERATSEALARFLGTHGFTVERPAFGVETAFAARAGSSGPEVVICCEMDALPDVGHACGHNIIATAALGAGAAVAEMADELGCRVTVLGTPAEERFGGKVDLIEAGAFAGAAAAMMVHPTYYDLVDPEVIAVVHVDIDFSGHESHASGAPHLGRNALDAAVQAYVNVSMLRQQILPTDRVHGIITDGGAAPNIIPGHTAMSWYVRAHSDERLDELFPKVTACFEAAAAATGCLVDMRMMGHRYKDMRSDPLLVGLYAANSEAIGRPMPRRADAGDPGIGSTDMGNVSYEVPSIHPMLDIHCSPAVNHQKEFAAHTVTADGDRAIRDGALAMAGTIIDLAEGDLWSGLST
ncbi:MAG: M20 family peptidase [Actinobacteria bacterium]|nr:MAG: M20 family peptidase [Actinomycetota bacterium]